MHILELLPASCGGVMGHSGGSWAVISPWKQQPGVGHSRVGLASAPHHLTPWLAAFLSGFPPPAPTLALCTGLAGAGGSKHRPGKWPDCALTNRLLNPGLWLLILSHADCCLAAPGSLCVSVFQAEDSAWLWCDSQNYHGNPIFKVFSDHLLLHRGY